MFSWSRNSVSIVEMSLFLIVFILVSIVATDVSAKQLQNFSPARAFLDLPASVVDDSCVLITRDYYGVKSPRVRHVLQLIVDGNPSGGSFDYGQITFCPDKASTCAKFYVVAQGAMSYALLVDIKKNRGLGIYVSSPSGRVDLSGRKLRCADFWDAAVNGRIDRLNRSFDFGRLLQTPVRKYDKQCDMVLSGTHEKKLATVSTLVERMQATWPTRGIHVAPYFDFCNNDTSHACAIFTVCTDETFAPTERCMELRINLQSKQMNILKSNRSRQTESLTCLELSAMPNYAK